MRNYNLAVLRKVRGGTKACSTGDSLRMVTSIQASSATIGQCMHVAMTSSKRRMDTGHIFITPCLTVAYFGYMPATPARYVASVFFVRLMQSKAHH